MLSARENITSPRLGSPHVGQLLPVVAESKAARNALKASSLSSCVKSFKQRQKFMEESSLKQEEDSILQAMIDEAEKERRELLRQVQEEEEENRRREERAVLKGIQKWQEKVCNTILRAINLWRREAPQMYLEYMKRMTLKLVSQSGRLTWLAMYRWRRRRRHIHLQAGLRFSLRRFTNRIVRDFLLEWHWMCIEKHERHNRKRRVFSQIREQNLDDAFKFWFENKGAMYEHRTINITPVMTTSRELSDYYYIVKEFNVSELCAQIMLNIVTVFEQLRINPTNRVSFIQICHVVKTMDRRRGACVPMQKVLRRMTTVIKNWDLEPMEGLNFTDLMRIILCDESFRIHLPVAVVNELMLFTTTLLEFVGYKIKRSA